MKNKTISCLAALILVLCISQFSFTQILPSGDGSGKGDCDDFDTYLADDFLCTQSSLWTTWDDNPGGDYDGYVRNTMFNTSPNSLGVDIAVIQTDVVYDLGQVTSGTHEISLDIYVPAGTYGAYYNVMQDMELFGASNEWGFQIYFKSDGSGYFYDADFNQTDFTYNLGAWNHSHLEVDLDASLATYYLNGNYIAEWQWDIAGPNKLGVLNIYAAADGNDDPKCFIDNVCYISSGVEPDIDVNPTSMTINQASKGNGKQSLKLSDADKKFKPPLNRYIVDTIVEEDGNIIYGVVVPGVPPGDHREPVAEPTEGSVLLPSVPAFNWSFGCSATSAAMAAGYYDNNDYPDMYTGPTNGGVCPMDNSVWPDVYINGELRHQCPLSATHNGLDGRTINGHVDDYWYMYGDPGPDPWIVNGWTEHTWGDCTGDYMGTNQSTYGCSDGATIFYYNNNGSPLYDYTGCEPGNIDGCHGMREFYESRGYTVVTNYTQLIYGYNGNTLGCTLADFQAEIDAGRPVVIQVEGHSMLGVGYEDGGSDIIYLHDTWDYSMHSMTWGGSYSGMLHYAMTFVELEAVTPPPPPANTFVIDNVGSAVLTVNSITDNKDWLSTSGYPATPFTINPGNGQDVTVDIDWGLLAGVQQTGEITVASDDPDEPSVIITVTANPLPLPDLTVMNQLILPDTAYPGDTIASSCEVMNTGTVTSDSCMLGYYLSADTIWDVSDELLATDDVDTLQGGETSFENHDLTIPTSTAAGNYYILFYADIHDSVQETNNSNNIVHAFLEVNEPPQYPDLIVENQSIMPASVFAGDVIISSCDVTNIGNAGAGSCMLRYFLSEDTLWDGADVLLGSDDIEALPEGQTGPEDEDLTIPLSTAAGNYYLLFFADADEEVQEENEENNIAYSSLTVTSVTPYIIVEPSVQQVGYEEGAFMATVLSNVDWQVTESCSWISCDPGSGQNNGSFEVAHLENTSGVFRSYTLTVSGEGVSDELTVIQDFSITINENEMLNGLSVYPNPFAGHLIIEYSMAEAARCQVTLFDHLGQVMEIIDENQQAGSQKVTLNTGDLPCGIYFYRIEANGMYKTGKVVKVR